jgi:hypothetical protein
MPNQKVKALLTSSSACSNVAQLTKAGYPTIEVYKGPLALTSKAYVVEGIPLE